MLHFRSRILSFEIQLLSCAIFALIDTQIREVEPHGFHTAFHTGVLPTFCDPHKEWANTLYQLAGRTASASDAVRDSAGQRILASFEGAHQHHLTPSGLERAVQGWDLPRCIHLGSGTVTVLRRGDAREMQADATAEATKGKQGQRIKKEAVYLEFSKIMLWPKEIRNMPR